MGTEERLEEAKNILCTLMEEMPDVKQCDWSDIFGVSQASVSQWKSAKNGMSDYTKVVANILLTTDKSNRTKMISTLKNKVVRRFIKEVCKAGAGLKSSLGVGVSIDMMTALVLEVVRKIWEKQLT